MKLLKEKIRNQPLNELKSQIGRGPRNGQLQNLHLLRRKIWHEVGHNIWFHLDDTETMEPSWY